MDCGECLMRFGLITFNIIFMLSGIAVLAVGIAVKVNPDVVNFQHLVTLDSGDDALGTAAYILIGFGVFVLMVSAFGFFTAICKKAEKCFVIFYIAFLILIFIGEFAGGISAAVFKGKIDDELPSLLAKTFNSYEDNKGNVLTKAWNYVQTLLSCCGSIGPKDYMKINFTDPDKLVQKVPLTCCVLTNSDPENPTPKDKTKCFSDAVKYDNNATITNDYLYTTGCVDKLNSEIKSHLVLIIGIGVGIAMLQLLGIVLAFCITCRDKDDY